MVKLRRLASGVFSPSKLVSTHVRDLFGEVLRFNQMQYMIVMLPLPMTLATRRFVVVKDDFWLNICTPDAFFDSKVAKSIQSLQKVALDQLSQHDLCEKVWQNWAEWTWTSGQAFWHVEENTP